MVGMLLLSLSILFVCNMLTLRYRGIVDVKHIRGEVAGMIYGPLTRTNDDVPAS